MDLITHAVVGAITGLVWQQPVFGAVIAVLPDLTLFSIKRQEHPTRLYNATHSLIGLAVVSAVAEIWAPEFTHLVFFCYVSHLVLDLPTHGEYWAPTLLYPHPRRFRMGQCGEWEFFNVNWYRGLIYASLWSATCILLLVIGSL